MRIILLWAALLLAALPCYAQLHTVSGYMTEFSSGEPQIGAAVVDTLSLRGALTNSYGFYSLTLPSGRVALRYSLLGYEPFAMDFELLRDTVVNISFTPSVQMLEGASVTASRSITGVRSAQMSAIDVPVSQIKSIPALAGEVDLVKALQLLPGVQSGTEGGTGLYVRGGNPDENLILLDGVPLYSINHMMGFFSVFNADAIKNVTLYKGDFPARFGGRLSSVVDVTMNDGNEREIHGSASIGLLAAKFHLEGPIVKEKTSFVVSARRTYFDLLSAPLIAAMVSDDESSGTGGYFFYDFNAKLTHKFSSRDKLYLSCYTGSDKVYLRMKDSYSYSLRDVEYSNSDKMSLGWKWGNIVGALRWNHLFSNKLFVNTAVSYTQYRHNMDVGADSFSQHNASRDTSTVSMGYNSLINDLTGRMDFEYKPHPVHALRFGGLFTCHRFNPSVTSMSMVNSSAESELISRVAIDTTFGDRPLSTYEAALYAEDDWDVCSWLRFNMGFRYSYYNASGTPYHSIEPRLGVRVLLGEDLSFKASYTRMSQYLHLLSNSNLSLPVDLWVPVTSRIKPMKSNQVTAGLFYDFVHFDVSLEGYYKTMDNVLEYRDGATFLGSTTGWEDKVATGRGWSYGLELLVSRKIGKLTGWVGYAWSRSWRLFDGTGNEINYGKVFPSKYDRIHDLSITASYPVARRIDLSATFIYGSGICGSLPLQDVVVPSYEEKSLFYDGLSYSELSYLEGRNNYRMPSYLRLDVGVDFHRTFRNGTSRIINVSVYNATNRNNPFMVYSKTRVEDGSLVPYLVQVSIFPIIPSVSYCYNF